MASSVERLVESRDRLGECPIWDDREQCLWWVDIHGQAIRRLGMRESSPAGSSSFESFPVPEQVGSIALREQGGLLAAMQSGIYIWDNEASRLLVAAQANHGTHRFNDGRCDRAGRFWVGTLQEPDFPPTGRLFRLEKESLQLKRRAISVPNSLAWSPDGRTMYFADSPRHKIWAFDYDLETGEASNERIFATPHPGFPDGSCVDAEGCLWNCEYGGARIVRYTPAGKVDRVIDVPVKEPTCCCFGGPLLDTLYVTSANGGGVFALVPGITGLPESRFSG